MWTTPANGIEPVVKSSVFLRFGLSLLGEYDLGDVGRTIYGRRRDLRRRCLCTASGLPLDKTNSFPLWHEQGQIHGFLSRVQVGRDRDEMG